MASSSNNTNFQIRLTGTPATPTPNNMKKRARSSTKSSPPSQQIRHTITITSSMTMIELINQANELFGNKKKGKKTRKKKGKSGDDNTGATDTCATGTTGATYMGEMPIEFWCGFPPKAITFNHENLVKECIQANDTIMVKFKSGGENITQQSISSTTSTTTASRKRTRTTSSTTIKSTPTSKTVGKVTTKSNSTNAKAKRAASAHSRKMALLPGGQSLNGSNPPPPSASASAPITTSNHSNPTSSSRTRSQQRTKGTNLFQGMNTQDDIATTLLSTINSGSGGKVSKVLRGAMRSAVEKTYDASRAVVRNSAISCPEKITFIAKGNSLGTTNEDDKETLSRDYTVHYPKGLEGRKGSTYQDEIEIISISALSAVVKAVHADHDEENDLNGGATSGREMLRPRNMAQLSPRVFWSLWFHFHHQRRKEHLKNESNGDDVEMKKGDDTATKEDQNEQSPCTSLEEALKQLLPTLDWSFLQSRSRELSEKAKDNLMQERGISPDDNDQSLATKEQQDAATELIQAVDDAMEQMHDLDYGAMRERAAVAALNRLSGSAPACTVTPSTSTNDATDDMNDNSDTSTHNKDNWSLETPTDLDEEELQECIVEGLKSCDSSDEASHIQQGMIEEWTKKMIQDGSIRNWRELANADGTVLFQLMSKSTSPATGNTTDNAIISESFIEKWIEYAQLRSIDEIMLEILDGDQDVYEYLKEEGNCSTPKDLSMWSSLPQMLLDEVPSLTHNSRHKDENSKNEVNGNCGSIFTVLDVTRWCQRSRVALNSLEWLEWYCAEI